MEVESREITAIETGLDVHLYPKWSPDGNRILFSVPDVWHLYIVNADGSNLFQLTDFRSNNADWSPDGQQIVFQSDHDNEPTDTPDIYVIDANGENLVELVDLPEAIDFNPRWSAQNEILLISSRAGNMEIFTMQADGSAITQVTDAKSPTTNADWSPDGERIAFVYGRNVTDIYHIQKDGAVTSVVRLTADEARDDHPTWSPDGSQIVYTSNKNGNNDLWIVNADGSAPTQLTNDEFDDYYPNWAP